MRSLGFIVRRIPRVLLGTALAAVGPIALRHIRDARAEQPKALLVLQASSMHDAVEGQCEVRFKPLPRLTPEEVTKRLRDGFLPGAQASAKSEATRVGALLIEGKVEFCTEPEARGVLRGALDLLKERELPKESVATVTSIVEKLGDPPLSSEQLTELLNREIANPAANEQYRMRLRGILASLSFARAASQGLTSKTPPPRGPAPIRMRE